MKNIKNNSNPKTNEEKSKYDNNTFNRKDKNLNKIEQKKEEEKEEEPPEDVVKVSSIDQMETIPLNPSIIKNPLLYNNIQQRIKHLLYRGRLPLFNVDNYTIKKTMGEGTNGVIYHVMNNKTKKNYAMKKLIASTIAELDVFQREFQICYENPHPYILNIYGVCARCFDSTTYVLYVLMALAENDLEMEISDRIKTKRYFPEKDLIAMLKKLVSALYFLQKERNVAHRDVKPENILIFKNDIVKLADFGEAKINNESKKKTIRGTEFYMSPLLYAGNLESKYDIQHNPFKSDVFSLGYCFIYASSLDYEIINEIRKISDQNKLRQILKKYFPKIYTSRYIELLLKMIVTDENQRIDFIGLQSLLQYY
jgi:serine/threonine protein kinase